MADTSTILLVDDEEAVRKVLTFPLERDGYTVVQAADGAKLRDIVLSLTPFRKIVKDYFLICESYYAAIKKLSNAQIEALDMGRRGLHNEGSEVLRERLAGKLELDLDTARRLFTLICALHIKA